MGVPGGASGGGEGSLVQGNRFLCNFHTPGASCCFALLAVLSDWTFREKME
jgi:hypothetical protein